MYVCKMHNFCCGAGVLIVHFGNEKISKSTIMMEYKIFSIH